MIFAQLRLNFVYHFSQRLWLDAQKNHVGVFGGRAIVGRDLHPELCGQRIHPLAVVHRGDDVFRSGDIAAAKSLHQDAAHFTQSEDGKTRLLRGRRHGKFLVCEFRLSGVVRL